MAEICKCGKAQRDIPVPDIQRNTYGAAPPAEPVISVIPRPAPLPMDFHNPIAVRIAFMAAVCATLLNFLVPILNWPAAGFFAVFVYGRKTGARLDVSSGVKLGWITGLLTSGLAAIVFAASLLPDMISGKLSSSI